MTALVTGAASGIGAEVAQRLARRGHRVIAVDRTEELADRAAATIGDGSIPVACDLTDAASTAGLCDRIATEWHDLEVLVCNAGIIITGNVADLSAADIDAQLDVLLRSPLQLIRAAVGPFTSRDRGHLMATVSLAGICPLPASATYSAAKAGLRAFLAALNSELWGTGVHVSGIYPTGIDTPMLRHEAQSDGSALNYLSKVRTVEVQRSQLPQQGADEVADAYERALDRPKLEIYVPYHESLSARAAQWAPAVIPRLLPFFGPIGERGRREYLRRLAE